MNVKKILQRVGVLAATTALLLGSTPVAAAEEGNTNLPTINTEKEVTLTITKYSGADTGLGNSTSPAGGTDSSITGTPLSGVTFSVVKVADLIQNQNDISLGYKLTAVGAAIWNQTESTDPEKKENDVVDGTALNTYIQDKASATYKEVFKGDTVKNQIVSGTTDEEGQVVFASANGSSHKIAGQGLYLVVETQAPASVTESSHPFFVSLPMTDKTTGNQWVYDVHAYPKNKTAETDIDKTIEKVNKDTSGIVTEDGEDKNKKAEAQIGDEIQYNVPLTAVVPEGGLTKLGINDTMDKGLTFNGKSDDSSCVTVAYAGSDQNFPVVTVSDYTVKVNKDDTTGKTTLKVYFTDDYINKINTASDKNPKFTFKYSATLNEDAVLGTTGNKNSVNFTYNYTNNPTPDSDVTSDDHNTTVYTWGIDLTKQGEDANKKLQDVEFTLEKKSGTDANASYTKMKFQKGENKQYYVPSAETTATETIKTDNEGKLYIRGLKSGTYRLTETKTNTGYQLLKEPIEIVIKGNNKTGEAAVTVAGKNVTLTEDTLNPGSTSALIPITVVNHKGFSLPVTGAAGIARNTMIGMVIVCICAFLLMSGSKKKRENRE